MPTRHGIKATVTNTSNQPLLEYGCQNLGPFMDRSKIVSTRIEAKDNLQFYIRVQPSYPFPLHQADLNNAPGSANVKFIRNPTSSKQYELRHEKRFNENTEIEEQERIEAENETATRCLGGLTTAELSTEPLPGMSKTLATAAVGEGTTKITTITGKKRSLTTSSKLPAYPPFDLTASVYIDGHEKPEARQVIYLNPNHSKFYPGGFLFKGRWVAPPKVTGNTGDSATPATTSIFFPPTTPDPREALILIRNWVFKSIPISVNALTSRFMTICSTIETPAPEPRSNTDRLLDDLTNDLSSNTLDASARPKPGQIEIRIRRIVAGAPNSLTPFKAYHYAGADETLSTDAAGGDTGMANTEYTHTTALRTQTDATGKEEKVRLNTVPWKPYRKGEDVFVKFVFNYTDRSKLVKLGLCDEDGKPTFEGRLHAPELEKGVGSKKRGKEDDHHTFTGQSLDNSRATSAGESAIEGPGKMVAKTRKTSEGASAGGANVMTRAMVRSMEDEDDGEGDGGEAIKMLGSGRPRPRCMRHHSDEDVGSSSDEEL